MNTLPRPALAPVVNIATRQPMEPQPKPKLARGKKMPWHQAPCRMRDPEYFNLTAGAMAALANLTELINTSGPVTGNHARVAVLVGLDRKTFSSAIEQLKGKWLSVVEVNGVLTIDKPTTNQPQTDHGPTTDQPQTSHNKTAINAGRSDRPLNKTIPIGIEEIETPLIPQGDLDGFDEWYAEFPPGKKNPVDAKKAYATMKCAAIKGQVLEGLRRAKAAYAAQHDVRTSIGWKFFKGPGAWLRASEWLTDYGTDETTTTEAAVSWFNRFAQIAQRVKDGQGTGCSDAELLETATKAKAEDPKYADRIDAWMAKHGAVAHV